MRLVPFVAALTTAVQPAVACPFVLPSAPLTARPAGTQAALLVDVVGVNLPRSLYVARVRVVRDPQRRLRTGATLALSYPSVMCGGIREPKKGERLVVYTRGDAALGWATPAEARRFDRTAF